MKEKTLFVLAGLMVAALIFSLGNTREDQFAPISHDNQIMCEKSATLIKDPSTFLGWRSYWPGVIDNQNVVGRNRIPEAVFEQARIGIRLGIKPEWMPPSWPNDLIGVRNHWLGSDVLVGRYRKGDFEVQLVEDSSSVTLLVRPNHWRVAPAESKTKFEQLVRRVVSEFTNYPEDKLPSASIILYERSASRDHALYSGAVNCEYEPEQPEKRVWWWNRILVWTDGEVVEFSYAKSLDGTPFVGGAKLLSDGRRFLDGL